jgi:hypothetical protein
MGIALGYAFLLALAGGLAAICFARLLELAEDSRPSAENEPHDAPASDRLSFGTAPPVSPQAQMSDPFAPHP